MTRALIGLGSIALIALKDKKKNRTQQQQQRLLTPQQYRSLPMQQRVGKTVSWKGLGSVNVGDWTLYMDGKPVGSISDFYETNRIGNEYDVDPISDEDMNAILNLQPGQTYVMDMWSAGIFTFERRGSQNALYSLEVETWLGDWDGWSKALAQTHPNLKLVHHQDTDDVSRGIIIGTVDDLWAFETEHMHIDNKRDPLVRKHFENRLKKER